MKLIPPTLPRLEHSLKHRVWPWAVLHRSPGLTGERWCAFANWHTPTPFAMRSVSPLANALQDNLIQTIQVMRPNAHFHYIALAGVSYQVVDWRTRLHVFTAEFDLF